uniref:TIL domain-containing protein n=1 Tax=Strongyloides papillosus TaxID=174720 RepID=A0A0N5C3Q0_STREA
MPLKKCYNKEKECKKTSDYACVCKKGYFLNDKNKCVKKDKCYSKPKTTKKPKTTTGQCPPNEIWANCRSACEPNCLDNIKKPKPCPRICKPAGCQCIEGFVRDDSTNTCVKRERCPKTTTPFPTTTRKCKKNEFWNYCGSVCEPKCSDDPKKIKPCPFICQVGGDCVCKKDYVRDDVTGECVKRKKCTKTSTPLPTTKPTCPKNEHFDECGTACPITCNNYYNIGCVCNEGYIRDKQTNQCVLPIQCSRNTTYECPKNQHFEICSTACPITCSNHKNPPEVCVDSCRIGCVCDKNYVFNKETEECVKPNECPTGTTVEPETTPVCPKNMVYTKCKSACEPRCGIPANVTQVCTKECAGVGCECREPFALDESNNCVEREKCKKPSKGGYYIIHMLRKTVTTMYTLIFRH